MSGSGWVHQITRTAFLILLFLGLLNAQPTTTTVADTLYTSGGTRAQGAVHIRLRTTCTAPGNYLIPALVTDTVFVTNGVFSKALVPNDTCVPAGTSYQVNYDLTTVNGTPSPRLPEIWVVPTSVTAVNISSVRVASPPPVVSSVSLSLITGGVTKGDLIVYNGSSFVRFPAGANGYVLSANSATSTGLEYITAGGVGTVTNAAPLTLDLPVFGEGGNAIKVGTKTGTGTQAMMSQEPTVTGVTLGNYAEATCDSSLRGRIAFVQGGAGVDDTARMCAKINETYVWRPIL